jgi:hypothetical protein
MPLDLAQARSALLLLERHFFSRTDLVAVGEGRGKPQPASGNLRALLATHLLGAAAKPAVVSLQSKATIASATMGHFRVGSYCLAADSMVRWLCLDFDGAGHANGLADPTAAALAAHREATARGVPAYLERSGGGRGWHLWMFFAEPVAAAMARRLGFALAPRDAMLADGRTADPESSLGIEVFPKQERIAKGGVGNLVWLPWWSGAAPGGNVFVRVVPADAPGPATLEPYLPESFDTVGAERLDEIIASLDAEATSRRVGAPPAPVLATDPTIDLDAFQFPPDEASASPDWRAWRSKAVAALRLEDVYGPWLTGDASSPGWLQCRDPWSPSGDRNPSAGVADGASNAERGTFHSFRSGQSLSVFDFLVKAGRAGSFADALKHVASLVRVPMPERQAGGGRPEAGGNALLSTPPASGLQPQTSGLALPRIVTNGRQTRYIVGDAWSAIHARNARSLSLFRRSGRIARIVRHEKPSPQATIELLDEAGAYGVLMRSADWVRAGDGGELAVPPVKEVAREILSSPHPQLPELDGIIEAPAFGADGTLVSAPGYNAPNAVWYEPHPCLHGLDVPAEPTPEHIAAARSLLLDDLLVDFPFVSPSDCAHAVAAIVLPFVRRMIHGCTPLHAFEAPAKGCGKNLLCECVAMIATGRQAEVAAIPDNDEEMRKAITSRLSGGASILLLDNARERVAIDSPALAAALTAQVWTDRYLGRTLTLRLPNTATWLLTGNNPKFSMELARRTVRIRIDPKTDRAWLRRGFKHVPLKSWIAENRRALVRAVLVLVQAWIAAGRPQGDARLGSFEEWSGAIGGILDVAGIPGFLGNLEDLYESSDAEGEEWRAFVGSWWQAFGAEPKRAAELNELCEREDLMPAVRGTGVAKTQHMRLARALSTARDRVFGDLRIVQSKDPRSKTCYYALQPVDDDGSRNGSACSAPTEPSQLELLDELGRNEGDVSAASSVTEAAGGVCGWWGGTTRRPPAGPPANGSAVESMPEEAPQKVAGGAGGPTHPYACASARMHARAHTRGGGTDLDHPHHPPGSADASDSETYEARKLAGGPRVVGGDHPPAVHGSGTSPPIDLAAFGDPDPGDRAPGGRYPPPDDPDHPPDYDPEDDP